MDDVVIEVKNLSKKFELRHIITDDNGNETNEIWALQDVSFQVKRGESIGIIGPNGSGKSTLLKILSGITKPTSGSVIIKGRVASVLDIGAGFHPELSGKENVYLNGQLQGFTKKEITAVYDEIVAFSGIGKFIAEPVKNYSNGMYLRLAFSIMAHLDFDVYLFDEVMNVGDAQFVTKAQQRMNWLSKQQKTIILVSHNKRELEIHEKYLFLQQGKLQDVSSKKISLHNYFEKAVLTETITDVYTNHISITDFTKYTPNNHVSALEVALYQGNLLNVDATLRTDIETLLEISYDKLSSGVTIDVLISIANAQGDIILSSSAFVRDDFNSNENADKVKLSCTIPAHFFNSQVYVLHVWFLKGVKQAMENMDQQLLLNSDAIEVVYALKDVAKFKPLYYKNGKLFDLSSINIQGALLPAFVWQANNDSQHEKS